MAKKAHVGMTLDADIKDLQIKLATLSANFAQFRSKVQNEAKGLDATFKKIGIAIAEIGIGIVAAKKGFEIFKTIMGSTHGTADTLEESMEAVRFTTERFFQMIASGDLTNFVTKLKDAATAGEAYARAMDRIQEMKLGLLLQKSEQGYAESEMMRIARTAEEDPAVRYMALLQYRKIAKGLAGEELIIAEKAVKDEQIKLNVFGVQGDALKELYEKYNGNLGLIETTVEKLKTLKSLQSNINPSSVPGVLQGNYGFGTSLKQSKQDIDAATKKYNDFYNMLTSDEKHFADLLRQNDAIKESDIERYIGLLIQQNNAKTAIIDIDKETIRVENGITKALEKQNKEAKITENEALKRLNILYSGNKEAKGEYAKPTTPFSYEEMFKSFRSSRVFGEAGMTKEKFDEQKKGIEGLQSIFENFFSSTMEGWKSFADTAINELKRLFAYILAKAVIFEILNIISGGAMSVAKEGVGIVKYITGGSHVYGTNFAPGGLSMVGERGPELVNLPRGSQVIPFNKGIQVQIVGTTRIRGRDLEIVWRRI